MKHGRGEPAAGSANCVSGGWDRLELIYFRSEHEVVLREVLSAPIVTLAVPIFLLIQFFVPAHFSPSLGPGILFLLIAM